MRTISLTLVVVAGVFVLVVFIVVGTFCWGDSVVLVFCVDPAFDAPVTPPPLVAVADEPSKDGASVASGVAGGGAATVVAAGTATGAAPGTATGAATGTATGAATGAAKGAGMGWAF